MKAIKASLAWASMHHDQNANDQMMQRIKGETVHDNVSSKGSRLCDAIEDAI